MRYRQPYPKRLTKKSVLNNNVTEKIRPHESFNNLIYKYDTLFRFTYRNKSNIEKNTIKIRDKKIFFK